MLDYLFAFVSSKAPVLRDALARFRPGGPLRVYAGTWGALAVAGDPIPGFAPVDSEDDLFLVLGSPLPRADGSVASGGSMDDGTRWIRRQWRAQEGLRWDEDLVGHFHVLRIDKRRGLIQVVTDLYIPAYRTAEAPYLIGSHSDATAWVMGGAGQIDPVSVADFLVYGYTAPPHTMYRTVVQLPPTSVVEILPTGRARADAYWVPGEQAFDGTIDDAARRLRELIAANVERMSVGQRRVGLMMSAGEDARVVAAMLPRHLRVEAFTVAETFNREARIARRVARTMGAHWRLFTRAPTHYVDHAPASICLAESCRTFLHAHMNGFTDTPTRGCRVFGALGANALFKGLRIHGRAFGGYRFRLDRRAWSPDVEALPHPIREEVERRHMSAEWRSRYPAGMAAGHTGLLVNRRLFQVMEPFLDNAVMKLSTQIPQEWTINRRLYHRAFCRELRRTWWIRHGNGTVPAVRGRALNVALFVLHRLTTRLHIHFSPGYRGGGSWPRWRLVAGLPPVREAAASLVDIARRGGLGDAELAGILEAAHANTSTHARLRQFQVRVWLARLLPDEDRG